MERTHQILPPLKTIHNRPIPTFIFRPYTCLVQRFSPQGSLVHASDLALTIARYKSYPRNYPEHPSNPPTHSAPETTILSRPFNLCTARVWSEIIDKRLISICTRPCVDYNVLHQGKYFCVLNQILLIHSTNDVHNLEDCLSYRYNTILPIIPLDKF